MPPRSARPLPDAEDYVPTGTEHGRTEKLADKTLKAGSRAFDTAAQPCDYEEAGVGRAVWLAGREGIARGKTVFRSRPGGMSEPSGPARAPESIETKFAPAEYRDPRRTPYDITTAPEQQVQESMRGSFADPGPTMDSVVLHQPATNRGTALWIRRVLETCVPHRVRRQPRAPPADGARVSAEVAAYALALGLRWRQLRGGAERDGKRGAHAAERRRPGGAAGVRRARARPAPPREYCLRVFKGWIRQREDTVKFYHLWEIRLRVEADWLGEEDMSGVGSTLNN
ncbi:hypothetical protein DL765_006005 [Monosporascus sp. GIB2]|nr:hypothetical protein DL765_006005 [Monosporascus sp. GIB2]